MFLQDGGDSQDVPGLEGTLPSEVAPGTFPPRNSGKIVIKEPCLSLCLYMRCIYIYIYIYIRFVMYSVSKIESKGERVRETQRGRDREKGS